ncbi:unnamed protein product [Meganyctiphanes norvegica]|uniref:C2H2-type domain-containing protein n=1 Tax=Meganyctiphanes norvegica TaxID=48144 RepID=A0AAV2RC68_MEGNR
MQQSKHVQDILQGWETEENMQPEQQGEIVRCWSPWSGSDFSGFEDDDQEEYSRIKEKCKKLKKLVNILETASRNNLSDIDSSLNDRDGQSSALRKDYIFTIIGIAQDENNNSTKNSPKKKIRCKSINELLEKSDEGSNHILGDHQSTSKLISKFTHNEDLQAISKSSRDTSVPKKDQITYIRSEKPVPTSCDTANSQKPATNSSVVTSCTNPNQRTKHISTKFNCKTANPNLLNTDRQLPTLSMGSSIYNNHPMCTINPSPFLFNTMPSCSNYMPQGMNTSFGINTSIGMNSFPVPSPHNKFQPPTSFIFNNFNSPITLSQFPNEMMNNPNKLVNSSIPSVISTNSGSSFTSTMSISSVVPSTNTTNTSTTSVTKHLNKDHSYIRNNQSSVASDTQRSAIIPYLMQNTSSSLIPTDTHNSSSFSAIPHDTMHNSTRPSIPSIPTQIGLACTYCSFNFVSQELFNKHIEDGLCIRLVSKPVNNRTNNTSENRCDRRKGNSTKRILYACHICNESFDDVDDLHVHKMEQHNILVLQEKKLKGLDNLPSKRYSCSICHKQFILSNELSLHLKESHNITNTKDYPPDHLNFLQKKNSQSYSYASEIPHNINLSQNVLNCDNNSLVNKISNISVNSNSSIPVKNNNIIPIIKEESSGTLIFNGNHCMTNESSLNKDCAESESLEIENCVSSTTSKEQRHCSRYDATQSIQPTASTSIDSTSAFSISSCNYTPTSSKSQVSSSNSIFSPSLTISSHSQALPISCVIETSSHKNNQQRAQDKAEFTIATTKSKTGSTITCPGCSFTFMGDDLFSQHLNAGLCSKLLTDIMSKKFTGYTVCNIKKKEQNNSTDKQNVSLMKKMNEKYHKMYICEICSAKFTTKDILLNHRKSAHKVTTLHPISTILTEMPLQNKIHDEEVTNDLSLHQPNHPSTQICASTAEVLPVSQSEILQNVPNRIIEQPSTFKQKTSTQICVSTGIVLPVSRSEILQNVPNRIIEQPSIFKQKTSTQICASTGIVLPVSRSEILQNVPNRIIEQPSTVTQKANTQICASTSEVLPLSQSGILQNVPNRIIEQPSTVTQKASTQICASTAEVLPVSQSEILQNVPNRIIDQPSTVVQKTSSAHNNTITSTQTALNSLSVMSNSVNCVSNHISLVESHQEIPKIPLSSESHELDLQVKRMELEAWKSWKEACDLQVQFWREKIAFQKEKSHGNSSEIHHVTQRNNFDDLNNANIKQEENPH